MTRANSVVTDVLTVARHRCLETREDDFRPSVHRDADHGRAGAPTNSPGRSGGLAGADQLTGHRVAVTQIRPVVATQYPRHRPRRDAQLRPEPVLSSALTVPQRQYPRLGVSIRAPVVCGRENLRLSAGPRQATPSRRFSLDQLRRPRVPDIRSVTNVLAEYT